MPQRVYATASDYFEFVGEDDPNVDGQGGQVTPPVVDKALNAQLRSASEEVDSLTLRAIFDIDEDGYPSNVDTADAFKRATCAIVQFWSITEDETGAEANVGAVKIGSVSLGTTLARQPQTDKLADRIGVKGAQILRNAGLISSIVNPLLWF